MIAADSDGYLFTYSRLYFNSFVPGNENLPVNDSFSFWFVDKHVS